ncbi:MAG: hypothetical protein D6725_04885 [Planctomycetota bacterium]|nr:MAG: hypothetical protein D6725_04885 [Planctomycetota bacterium]
MVRRIPADGHQSSADRAGLGLRFAGRPFGEPMANQHRRGVAMAEVVMPQNMEQLLPILSRSLLQYAVYCWPWTSPEEEFERTELQKLAERQERDVERIVAFLDERERAIDLGIFDDWSWLHFVSVDFLLKYVVANQEQVVEAVKAARRAEADDPDARQVLDDVLREEEAILAELRRLHERSEKLAAQSG